MSGEKKRDWKTLQRRVFSRWINNKMVMGGRPSRFTEDTLISGWGTGCEIVDLVETLSKNSMPNREKKLSKAPKGRIQQMNSVTEALEWVLAPAQKIKMDLKPSAANLVDGEEKIVMGLVWCTMRSYLNFGADDDRLSAEEALLRWVQRQLADYDNVTVKNFGKDWHNGLAFCGLIHKYRPNLIGEWSSLSADNGLANIALAQDAAYKWFGLEKYIDPEDIEVLDDKSMIIYVSEFYNGINRFHKIHQAAKRVGDVISFTETNDSLKEEYIRRAKALKEKFDPVVQMLSESTSERTLAAAKSKLEAFEHFKSKVKDGLINEFLSLEGFLNVLTMRLADAKRPDFVVEDGLRLSCLRDQFKTVEGAEAKQLQTLINNYNRLLGLSNRAKNHASKCKSMTALLKGKLSNFPAPDAAPAAYFVNYSTTFAGELKDIDVAFRHIVDIGKALVAEDYEDADGVATNEGDLAEWLDQLRTLAVARARQFQVAAELDVYKDSIHGLVEQHQARFDKLSSWLDGCESAVNALSVDQVNSIRDANQAISRVTVLRGDRNESVDNCESFEKIGSSILNASFSKGDLDWKPDSQIEGVQSRLQSIADRFAALDQLLSAKEAELEQAKSAEVAKENARLQFADAVEGLKRFCDEIVDESNTSTFGFTLEDVRTFDCDALDGKTAASLSERVQNCNNLNAQATQLNVGSNPYTKLTTNVIIECEKAVSAAAEGRKRRRDAELQRLSNTDAACAAFAEVANPWAEWLLACKDKVTNSVESLDKQLEAVQGAKVDAADDSKLKAVLEKEVDVPSNPYTHHTAKTLRMQWEQYAAFLDSKETLLKDQMAAKRLRGMTQEQYDLMFEQFNDYDKNKDKQLNAEELSSCLFAQGESRKKEEIAEILKTFGNANNEIEFDAYVEYMVSVLGGQNTADKVSEALVLINNGHEARIELMEEVFTKEQMDYIKATAPKDESGNLDMKKWVEDTFSR